MSRKPAISRKTRGFTPGPWHHYHGKLRPQYDTIIDEIKDTDGRCVVAWPGFDGVENRESNARLIAAAPDLYDALTMILERCKGSIHTTDQETGATFAEIAECALATARGEAT